MDKDNFSTILGNFQTHLNEETSIQIQELREAYPYCGILHELILLNKKAIETPNWISELPLTAVYAANRQLLKEKLNSVSAKEEVTVQKNGTDTSINPLQTDIHNNDTNANKIDVLSEIDLYQEISLKTAPKSVLIEKFLEIQSPKINKPKDRPENITQESHPTENKTEGTGFLSETLAILYEKKGAFAKAIQIYEQLSLKYPEKSNTFADQIDRLNSLTNNSN